MAHNASHRVHYLPVNVYLMGEVRGYVKENAAVNFS